MKLLTYMHETDVYQPQTGQSINMSLFSEYWALLHGITVFYHEINTILFLSYVQMTQSSNEDACDRFLLAK